MSVVVESRDGAWIWDDALSRWDDTSVTWDSANRKEYSVRSSEVIAVRERTMRQSRFMSKHFDALSVSDDMSRTVRFAERMVYEDIGIGDTCRKELSLTKDETLPSITDVFLENANAVIDMVSVYNGTMNETTFLDRSNTVNGYSPFQELYVGDYEYEKALVRLSVQSEQLDSGINLYNVIYNVDIPDTDDKGRVMITDTTAPTKVYYNKFYYHAPEVSVDLVGGSTANNIVMPVLLTTEGQDEDGRYFEIELIGSDGERKSGTIIWVAKGY